MTTTSASIAAHEIPARQGMRRFALRIDAVVSGANGVAYLALAGPLADLFGVSGSLLRPVGAFFLVWAAALWLLSSREAITRGEMIAVAALNAVWVAGLARVRRNRRGGARHRRHRLAAAPSAGGQRLRRASAGCEPGLIPNSSAISS